MAHISLAKMNLYDDLNENIENCKTDITRHNEMLVAQLEVIRKLHSNDKMFTSIIADIINVQRKHMREIKLLKKFSSPEFHNSSSCLWSPDAYYVGGVIDEWILQLSQSEKL